MRFFQTEDDSSLAKQYIWNDKVCQNGPQQNAKDIGYCYLKNDYGCYKEYDAGGIDKKEARS